MLSARQQKAIKRMFHLREDEVAKEVGVKPETIAKWMRSHKFRAALNAEEEAVRAAAARITSEASLAAAKRLHEQLSNQGDAKLALDTLKASGAFNERETKGPTLEEAIREVAANREKRS